MPPVVEDARKKNCSRKIMQKAFMSRIIIRWFRTSIPLLGFFNSFNAYFSKGELLDVLFGSCGKSSEFEKSPWWCHHGSHGCIIENERSSVFGAWPTLERGQVYQVGWVLNLRYIKTSRLKSKSQPTLRCSLNSDDSDHTVLFSPAPKRQTQRKRELSHTRSLRTSLSVQTHVFPAWHVM